MSQKSGKLIVKKNAYEYSLKLNAQDEEHWLETQRPLIENVVGFFNDRQLVNKGVTVKIDWDPDNNRWYHIQFESIDDANLFEITFAEYL
jgi:hypothetical protein